MGPNGFDLWPGGARSTGRAADGRPGRGSRVGAITAAVEPKRRARNRDGGLGAGHPRAAGPRIVEIEPTRPQRARRAGERRSIASVVQQLVRRQAALDDCYGNGEVARRPSDASPDRRGRGPTFARPAPRASRRGSRAGCAGWSRARWRSLSLSHPPIVIASAAWQSRTAAAGLLRRCAPRNDGRWPCRPKAPLPTPKRRAIAHCARASSRSGKSCAWRTRIGGTRRCRRSRPAAWLGLVGLAPGMWGANRTGRPFTGDHAGQLLFATLLKCGLAEGRYAERPGDGLRLRGCIILNSVKCLPPQNKPTPAEVATCRRYYEMALARLAECGCWSRSAASPMTCGARCRRQARRSPFRPARRA